MKNPAGLKYDLFLSHSHADEAWASQLATRLEGERWRGRKLRVFFSPWDIRVGQLVPQRIEEGLRESRRVAVILSPKAVGSAWVGLERLVTTYMSVPERADRLIPILRRSCRIPELLQPILYVDFRDDARFEESLKVLLAVIEERPIPRRCFEPLQQPGTSPPAKPHLSDIGQLASSAPDAALAPRPPTTGVVRVGSKQKMAVRPLSVRPMLPEALARLEELVHNLLWSWEPGIRNLFRRLDPVLWRATRHNPVLMLGKLPQSTLDRAAADPRFLALYRRACEYYDACVADSATGTGQKVVVFFSMEYGLVECVPNYASGMGVVAGDFLKALSDLGYAVVAVGLLYQKGYPQQWLNPDGWQQERSPDNDFYTLPVVPVLNERGDDLKVSVALLGRRVYIKVWRMDVGRIPLYLLDTNIPDNERLEDREITDQIYFGDMHTRIRQEIVLGIGGLRALRALGLDRTVYHMNESHSAFLAIERVRLLMQEHGLTFHEGLEASRASNVFTTHTPVPAGVDLFDRGLMYEYFSDFCREARIQFEQLMALGRFNPSDDLERFSMAVLAIRTSSYRIAVSRLHGWVARELWQNLWPELLPQEIPILSITNGVHLPSWLNADLATLYDQYLQPDWRAHHDEAQTWEEVQSIPTQELWEARRRRKRRLINFAREALTAAATTRKASAKDLRRLAEVLDPDALTIGFARRFATYKRSTLLFRDVNRLKAILCNPERPVQIVLAGRAHPKDHPGKELIRQIIQFSRDPEIANRLVFLENYDIEVARELVQGVDVWLSTPRRGEEACGTSGMKAGLNGVLNLSILDGWFDEAYEIAGGWAIGDQEPYSEDQDETHANALYWLLENEIVPMYYSDREEGRPQEWMRRVQRSIKNLSPRFCTMRMAKEYISQVYEPAQAAYSEFRRDNFQRAREQSRRGDEIAEGAWAKVRIGEIASSAGYPVTVGQPVSLRADVEMVDLQPDDVAVEAVLGRIGAGGQLEDTELLTLSPVEKRGPVTVFAGEVMPRLTGRLGFAIRIRPRFSADPLTLPCNPLIKWATDADK